MSQEKATRPAAAAAFAVLAAAVFGGGWYLAHRTGYLAQSFAHEVVVTGAMAVAVPVLYFVLVAIPRRQGIIPLLAGFLVCTLLAGAILPDGLEAALGYVERALVVTETLLLALVALRISRIVRYFRAERASGEHYGFTRQLGAAAASAVGSKGVGELLAAEVTNFYYSLFFYLAPSEVPAGGVPFTSYRKGYKPLFVTVVTIGALELVMMHVLLEHLLSSTVAWVVTALSIYGLLFFIADFVAMVKRPSMVYRGRFYFHMGLRWSAMIPLDQISGVEKLAYNRDTTGMMQCAVQKQMANAVIHFTEVQTVKGMLGITRTGGAVILNVDDLPGLMEALAPTAEPPGRGKPGHRPLPAQRRE